MGPPAIDAPWSVMFGAASTATTTPARAAMAAPRLFVQARATAKATTIR